jgi:hypothetical protein
MELMQQSSTDKRLDDLNVKVDHRFEQVDLRFAQVDQRFEQIDQRFEQVDQRFEQIDHRFDRVESELRMLRVDTKNEFVALRGEMKAGFERMEGRLDERFDGLHRLMIQFCGLMLAALIGLIASLTGVLVMQLW